MTRPVLLIAGGGRGIGAAIEKQEIQSERITCEREHCAELSCAHDAYGHR